jgi:hypothetical protein
MAKKADEQKKARRTVVTLYVLIAVLTILPFVLLVFVSLK